MTDLDQHPELAQTHALADGELTGAELEAAQDHLATCELCQSELADVMQMKAMPVAPANVVSLAWYRKRSTQVASVLVAAAAAATVLYIGGRHPATPTKEAPVKIALAETRAVEARLSWQGASDYRAYSVPRGQSLAKEPISLSAMADTEKRGDMHGVAALALLAGDFEQAKKYLAQAGDSADVLADNAALELSLGAPDKALAFADRALDKSPDATVATWNKALALRDLGLRHDALEAFRAVAKHGEAGWAAEATKRADELERTFKDETALRKRVGDAALPLARTQSGLAIDDAKRLPGASRVELYDALRAAPDAAAVAKLMPLAEAIDSVGGDHGTVDAVKAAKPDPKAAAAYLSILADAKADRAKILATLRAAHANDALAVALVKFGREGHYVLPADLAEFTKLTQASTDPWIQLLGVEQRGYAAIENGDLPGAEAILLSAREQCKAGAAPSYRCMKIEMLLGRTYLTWQRWPEAQTVLLDAWSRALATGAIQQNELLSWLTNLATLSDDHVGGGLPLVRAYTSELTARAIADRDDAACDYEQWGREQVAFGLQMQQRFEDAKRELGPPVTCPVNDRDGKAIADAFLIRAEVLHVVGTPAEIAALRAEIVKARTDDRVKSQLAMLDHAEGRVAIGVAPGEGVALLRHAIEIGKPDLDVNAQRAVGMSYAVLTIHAAKTGDAAGALAILGEEIGAEPRTSCVLGIVGDDRELATIARNASGQTSAVLGPRPLVPEPDKLVGKDTLSALAGCKNVDVIARPPYDGMSRILPDDIAWRYVSSHAHATAASTGNSLVVADVEPPASLGLPHLANWSHEAATTLTGPAATPARVLDAIGQARDVTIHAHGFAGEGDASYLALSPDPKGQYALTAREVSHAKLASAPLVILAACESAKAAARFAARWSLPNAFLTAGARAVVAPTTAVPDQEAGPFFDQLRTRAAAGVPLAEVVRDLRKQWLADRKADWVRDVVVFE